MSDDITGELPPEIAMMGLREREVYYRARILELQDELRTIRTESDPLNVSTRNKMLNLRDEVVALREQLGKMPAKRGAGTRHKPGLLQVAPRRG